MKSVRSRFTPRLAVALAVGLSATLVGPASPAPAADGVTRVASSSNDSSASRASITLSRPAGAGAGHVLVASIVSHGDDRFSAPAGWTVVRDDSVPDRLRQTVYVRVADPAEPGSYTWRLPKSRRVAGGITAYSGVDGNDPVDTSGGATFARPGKAVTAPSITTSVAGTMLVHLAAVRAEGSLSPPAGMSERWEAKSRNRSNSQDAHASSSDAVQGAAGATEPRTATASKAGPRIGAALALRPAPSTPPPDPDPDPDPDPVPPPSTKDPVLVGAGDIATCVDTGDEATAAILDDTPGTVFTLGDNVYINGTAKEYAACYHPTWGRHKARTAIAVAGNHDYGTDGAAGYYGYYGTAAGDPAKGYYDTRVGSWHVIVLNSNCEEIGGCEPGSAQERWLRRVLAASDAECTVALWHHPYFSSATVHRSFPAFQAFWQALYDHGADVVLVASDHVYERFGLQTPAGKADAVFGVRQFTVGTGGRSHQSFKTPLPNSEVRNGGTYGVLKLTLRPGSYDWRFLPEAGKSFTDSGTTACHDAPTKR